MVRRQFQLLAVSLAALLVVSGCASPVGVKRIGEPEAYRTLTASVLSGGDPSSFSRQFIARLNLVDRYYEEPKVVLAELHAGLGGLDARDRLFALSELSYAYAIEEEDPSYFLASAVYAYAFLFPEDATAAPSSYDPRLRLAVDLYNLGITNGLRSAETDEIDLSAREFALPFGSLKLSSEPSALSYGGHPLKNLVAMVDFEIRGLRNRYRGSGIGAGLVGKIEKVDQNAADLWLSPWTKVPVTAFVRFDLTHGVQREQDLTGTIELYDVIEIPSVRIGQYTVPLTFEWSAALAYNLEWSPVWDFEFAGFRSGTFRPWATESDKDLFFLHPYLPGKIPVVFVHGTMSSPARWAEMVNELVSDPRIAGRYQFWYFIYNSGNPISLSAMYLRESLAQAVKGVDPEAKDPALRQMVVLGHSQGGLLTKMTVVRSGNRFIETMSETPLEQWDVTEEAKSLLRRSFIVEPLPFVRRVIFIATPHRGSFMAENIFGKIGRKFINLPAAIVKTGVELATLDMEGVGREIQIPTAIDNMDGKNPFNQTLASLPIAEGVRANSIIPVKGDGPPEEGDDGVVRYTSAHIEGVESELIVRSGHSTQSMPQTIEEVRRILYTHAGIQ